MESKTVKNVPERLRGAAALFEERNRQYGSNYKCFGAVMAAMYPEGLTIRSAEEWTRLILQVHRVTKETRYACNFGAGGHADSLEDLSVYAQMAAETDDEARALRAFAEKLGVDLGMCSAKDKATAAALEKVVGVPVVAATIPPVKAGAVPTAQEAFQAAPRKSRFKVGEAVVVPHYIGDYPGVWRISSLAWSWGENRYVYNLKGVLNSQPTPAATFLDHELIPAALVRRPEEVNPPVAPADPPEATGNCEWRTEAPTAPVGKATAAPGSLSAAYTLGRLEGRREVSKEAERAGPPRPRNPIYEALAAAVDHS